MIKTFIDKLLGKASGRQPSKFGKREDVPAAVHAIERNLVDQRALDVVHTLKQGGFEAYIVGGAVRDLLLGLRPKDFDVATSATPEQVKSLFRRAFIIGRRFRIVHVVYGRGRDNEVIEVSTFRAYLDAADADQVKGNERTSKGQLAGMTHAVDASGRVLRDNVWGPIEQDAARRDFSINAMYYDPESQTVVDFHSGIRDAQKKTLRMIGDAATRYREDPVRIIRAVRFAAKLSHLGFKFDPKTLQPLAASHKLLADVPQSRLFDEMLKLLQTGHSLASVAQLREVGLSTGIYPLLDVVVERADDPFVKLALQDTDRRVAEGKPVAPSFLLACVLWADVRKGWNERLQPKGNRAPRHRRRRCSTRSMWCLTAALVMCRGAASWVPTCAKSGSCSRALSGAPATARSAWWTSRAFALALIFCACAPRSARSRKSWPTGGKPFRTSATTCAKTWWTRSAKTALVAQAPARRAA